MDRFDDMNAFIERTAILYVEELKRLDQHNYEKTYAYRNPEGHNECVRKYCKSEKGRYAETRKKTLSDIRIRHLIYELSPLEIEDIRSFYENCPDDHEVDHVIPLSKGGRHHVSNLQYLTPGENREKHDSLDWGPNKNGWK